MNFLIFDKGNLSPNLVDTILADFRHVTLVSSEESLSTIPSSSPTFLLVNQVNISNANEVIQILSKHERDPFDALLMFNASSYSDFQNILQTMRRLKRQPPHLFLIFIGQPDEIDKNINKLLRESSESITWTVLICNQINASTTKNYKLETKPDPKNHQVPIASSALFDFICNEINTKKQLQKIIYIY
ncbi:unnamed protein product [Rotaria magnacalcarata]|uniref:Uncharacterized protein n=3 Tax=Rotaria magnacalcarata TaxID=392030 RepID=A0A816LRL0_9BILA|nr:unnamed protein product [Rotaria magnacalcarata]CAF1630310.1 unnamed protein product [Rotaria magnacalcarata]CAF1951167.1 unnamed protein product [Rotaria magnacalcarata]CAF2145827.1 unnamed protein product [Rotaria magnacalcarata]CAF3905324.1 unnamed protein product [Rotaria magnacalcarata]